MLPVVKAGGRQDTLHQSGAVVVTVACLSCLRLIKCGSLGLAGVLRGLQHQKTEAA